ncbi:MAG: hypothetical protein EXR04_05580 [Rhodospirillales bacterium]|nr:hypothetical protein [Rhodospirillales bacterium]
MLFLTLSFAVALSGCGQAGKDDRAAYAVCMVAAKNDARIGKATFATFEQSNIQASTGDAGIRVNVPYELDGKKGLYQCIAEKQIDNSFKVVS